MKSTALPPAGWSFAILTKEAMLAKEFRPIWFVMIWGLMFLLPGRYAVWGWPAAVTLWFIFRNRNDAKRIAIKYDFPVVPELFTLPRLAIPSEPLTQDPEIVAFQARYGESLTRDLRHFENPYSGLYLIGWLSAILCVAALFLPWTSALGVALTASVLCACNLLFYLPIRRRIRKVMGTMIQLAETRKQELFRRLNRPPLDLYDTQSRDHFSRYYEDVYQFRLAMELVCAAGVKHMIYPEDSFLIVCGTHYDSVLKNLHLQDSAKLRQDNVGEVLQEKLRVSKTSLYLPFPCELTNAPPWPEALYKLAERRLDGEWPPFPNREARRIFAARPQLSAELFASYWATRREATVALAIRDLTDEHMDRPDNFMSYPNDPLALLVLWDCDSLETEELLMAMEEHFNIVIPDGEATQLFCHMSLAEAVKYIIWKQDSAICNREATPALPGA